MADSFQVLVLAVFVAIGGWIVFSVGSIQRQLGITVGGVKGYGQSYLLVSVLFGLLIVANILTGIRSGGFPYALFLVLFGAIPFELMKIQKHIGVESRLPHERKIAIFYSVLVAGVLLFILWTFLLSANQPVQS